MRARHTWVVGIRSIAAVAMLVGLGLAGMSSPANAAVGDLLRTIQLSPGAQCTGAGTPATSVGIVPGAVVGFPQHPVLVVTSCANDSKLFFSDPTVAAPASAPLVLTVTMVDGPGANDLVPSVGFGSLALRGDKADLVGCGNNNGNHGIFRIELSKDFATTPSPTARVFFLFNGNLGHDFFYCDGVAWDAVANRVYQKPDVYIQVFRFDEAGAADGTPINVPTTCAGNGPDGFGASGVAIGGQSLFFACNGDLEIFQVDKASGAFIRSFPTAGQRTEDLECDQTTFGSQGKDAIWSKDAHLNQLFAFEIPKGTCGAAGGAAVAVPALGPLCAADGLADTDGDGILDCWEKPSPLSAGAGGVPCIDFDGDGICDYKFCPALGHPDCPDPYRKDVYVEIDWLENHQPPQTAITAVINRFAAATTVTNPTNPVTGQSLPGVVLHVQIDPDPLKDPATGNTIPHNASNSFGNDKLGFQPYTTVSSVWDFDQLKAFNFGTNAERTTGTPAEIEKRLNGKRQVFRYAILHHLLDLPEVAPGVPDTTSGYAEVHGNDFGVTLGSGPANDHVQNPLHIAGTFMHELGHNLGLRHGGDQILNGLANYLSVMSYTRQFPEAPIETQQWLSTVLNYSTQPLPNLNEANLDEAAGIGIPTGTSTDVTVFGCPTPTATTCDFAGQAKVVAAAGGIDWNRDGTNQNPTPPPTDINRVVAANGTVMTDGTGTAYHGFDDWRAPLKYNIRNSTDFADGVRFSLIGEDRELQTAVAEAISGDRDGDGIKDFNDNCPDVFNSDQNDACELILVLIDIKPNASPNILNLKSEGTLQFAILGSTTFDVTQINPSTVVLSGAPAKKCKVKDENSDGFPDLSCEVLSGDLTLGGDAVIAVFTGLTFSGRPLRGEDTIIIKKGP